MKIFIFVLFIRACSVCCSEQKCSGHRYVTSYRSCLVFAEACAFVLMICWFYTCSAAIMDQLNHLTNLESLKHDATIEEGPSTPDKMVSGLSICCDKDRDEMWAVPVQEKGPHLPEELAMTT